MKSDFTEAPPPSTIPPLASETSRPTLTPLPITTSLKEEVFPPLPPLTLEVILERSPICTLLLDALTLFATALLSAPPEPPITLPITVVFVPIRTALKSE